MTAVSEGHDLLFEELGILRRRELTGVVDDAGGLVAWVHQGMVVVDWAAV
jgi:hypothetical protein